MSEIKKKMSDQEIIKNLREALVPKGTAPVVRLFLNDMGGNYFNEDFVQQCINDFETKIFLASTGLYEITALEKLAIHVLLDSAYIDKKGV